jgi:pimeloyl-ACP methyl ester carboxylesterase
MLRRPLGVAGSTAAVGRWLPDFIAEPAGAAPPLSGDPARYAAVPWPTLVLWGALDDITPPAAGEALARRVPGATWHLLHGIGHIPALEAPAAFNDALLGFLRTRAPAAPAAARRGGAARAESRPPGAR